MRLFQHKWDCFEMYGIVYNIREQAHNITCWEEITFFNLTFWRWKNKVFLTRPIFTTVLSWVMRCWWDTSAFTAYSCWCVFLLLFKRIRQNWFSSFVHTQQLNFEHRVELTDETLLPSQQKLSCCWWEEGFLFLLLFDHKKWPWRSWTQEARRRGASLGMNGIICPAACCFSVCRFLLGMVLFSRKPDF